VRELVGDDGRAVVDFMYCVLCDKSERTETRMDAGKWLVERVWGRPALAVELKADDPVSAAVNAWSPFHRWERVRLLRQAADALEQAGLEAGGRRRAQRGASPACVGRGLEARGRRPGVAYSLPP
jgi:hypothetical protein